MLFLYNFTTMVVAEKHIHDLPEDCICTIISLTSPPDVVKLSLVSSTCRSATESDYVWNVFLPCDWQDIARKSVTLLKYTTKKELFLCLCNSILIHGGNKVRLKRLIYIDWFTFSCSQRQLTRIVDHFIYFHVSELCFR